MTEEPKHTPTLRDTVMDAAREYVKKQGTSYPLTPNYIAMIESQLREAFYSGFEHAEYKLKELQEERDKLKGWISVKDQMPQGDVLLCTTSKIILIGDRYQNMWRVIGRWQHNGTQWASEIKDTDVTHWKPLPELP